MKIPKLNIRLATIGALSVLFIGYALLIAVIVFREEINLALTPATPAVAGIEVASVQSSQSVDQISSSLQSRADYVQQLLNNPQNFQPYSSTSLLPAEARALGEQTSFLIGF